MKLHGSISALLSFPPRRLLAVPLALSLFALGGSAMGAGSEDLSTFTVPKLIEALHSDDKQTRRDAVEELGHRGEAAHDAVPQLVKMMDDPDQQISMNTVEALSGIGPGAVDAIPALIDAMNSKKAKGYRSYLKAQSVLRLAQALSRIGPAAIPGLKTALASEDAQQRAGAARALGGMGPAAAGETAPLLIKNLADGADPVRQETVDALSQMGAPVKDALVAALVDGDPKRRAGAALALAQLGGDAKGTGPAVTAALDQEKDSAAKAAELTALPKIGADPAKAAALLVSAVTDQDEAIRHAGINALAGARPLQKDAVASLSALLKNPDAGVRQRAAKALGRLGPNAADALSALVQAASAAGGDDAFSDAIVQMGPKAMPVLLAALKDARPGASDWIFHALSKFGAASVPALMEALKTTSPEIRIGAIRALGGMGLDAAPSIHTLFAEASDADSKVQATALRALVALKADPNQLKPMLEKAMASSSPEVKKAAAAGVAATGGASAMGVDGLTALLNDEDAAGRLIAVQALGELGEKGAPAVPALMEHFDDPSLQYAVVESLKKIGPAAAPATAKLALAAQKLDGDQKANMLRTLAAIGRSAGEALPLIRTSIADTDKEVRSAAVTAFAAVDSNEDEVISKFTDMLKNDSSSVRRAIAPELAKFGSRSSKAVPGLIAMMDRDTDRSAALSALKAIGVREMPDLLKLLAMREAKVQVFACDSLGALGSAAKDAAPRLHDLAASGTPVQDAARKALARIEPAAVGK